MGHSERSPTDANFVALRGGLAGWFVTDWPTAGLHVATGPRNSEVLVARVSAK